MTEHPPAARFRPADRISGIGVSEILAIGAKATAMKQAGKPVIILGAGEPDFETPANVRSAAIAAIERGETRYTALDGTPALKRAICTKFSRENGVEAQPSQISVATGAKQILFNAFLATLDPGDEVVIPTPYWTSYSDIVRMAGGEAVLVPCDDSTGFLMTPEQLRRALTPKTRWLLLNSPSNPTGAAYGAAQLRALGEVLADHPDVWLMSDEIYEHITYGNHRHVSARAALPELADRTLVVNGISKAYAMTGWRIGYGLGPEALIKAMAVVQSQSTSCPNSIAQAAAIEALDGPQDFLAGRSESFRQRRDLVVGALNAIDGITCRMPEGAFYTFANCRGMIGRRTPEGRVIGSDRDFCAFLLETALVATVPGAAFGLSPYFRVSYATSTEELTEALQRIAKACRSLG